MLNRRLVVMFFWISLGIGLSLAGPFTDVSAQSDNLLADPGFEDTAMKPVVASQAEGVTFSVNAAWNGWYTESPRTADWQNRIPNGTGRNNAGLGFVRSGNRSMELSRGFATFTAAIYQTVNVQPGSTVRGSAWYVMDLSEGASAQARVGIDPNGGTNPYDSDIVWSSWGGNQLATGGFRQLTATATSTGSSVTIFLFATQRFPSEQNGIFWDDVELVVTATGNPPPATSNPTPSQGGDGTGGDPAPQPTRTQVVITPQAPNPDGSIIHQISSGETLSTIAQAYGKSVSALLTLNPSLGDGSVIFPQDLIIIVPPPGFTPAPRTTTAATFTPPPVEATTVAVAIPDPDVAVVCVMMYEDLNTNGVQDSGEPPLAGGTVALQQGESQIQTFITDGNAEPYCFDDQVPGTFTVAGSPPPGYGLAGSSRRLLDLQEGGSLTVPFAAVRGPVDQPALDNTSGDTQPLAEEVDTPDDSNTVLQVIGLLIFGLAGVTLVFGIGVTFLLRQRY